MIEIAFAWFIGYLIGGFVMYAALSKHDKRKRSATDSAESDNKLA
jgi:cytosine/uracil/thiamine/allantoin permease